MTASVSADALAPPTWAGAVRALDPEAQDQEVLAVIEAVLAPGNERDGWEPGSAHPTGGYFSRRVVLRERPGGPTSRAVVVEHRDESGDAHREDGPAVEGLAGAGRTWQKWMRHGADHRDDGPATVFFDADGALDRRDFAIDGHTLNSGSTTAHAPRPPESLTAQDSAAVAAYYDAMLAEGLEPSEAISWLALASATSQDVAAQMRTAGADPAAARGAALAGVVDLQSLAAVATGVLPLSWAIAGLER